MIRVLIKAPSPVVRAGLESLIRPYGSLRVIDDSSGESGDPEGAIADLQPDVVLAELESQDDTSASEVLEEAANGVPVVLLVRGALGEWAEALRQGVKAVLPIDVTGPQIAAAIEAVVAGLVVFHSTEVESLLQSHGVSESPETLPEALTPREIEVLRSLAAGFGNKEIASRLGISEHTVKFHVASIMGKLGAASRTEAVTLGIRHGLVLV